MNVAVKYQISRFRQVTGISIENLEYSIAGFMRIISKNSEQFG